VAALAISAEEAARRVFGDAWDALPADVRSLLDEARWDLSAVVAGPAQDGIVPMHVSLTPNEAARVLERRFDAEPS